MCGCDWVNVHHFVVQRGSIGLCSTQNGEGRERGKEVTCIFGMPVGVSIITTQEVATGDAKTLCPMHTASASQYLTNCLKDQQCSQEDEIFEGSKYKTFFLIRVNYIVSKSLFN